MSELQLRNENIQDRVARDNFQKISESFRDNAILQGFWRFYEIAFTGAVLNKRIPHKLGFKPKDIIQTSLTGAGSLTWNYSLFDITMLDVTTTGPCVVRLFAGTYNDGVASA